PFVKQEVRKPEAKEEEKIVMVLGQEEQPAKKAEAQQPVADPLAPRLVDEQLYPETPMPSTRDIIETEFIREEEPVTLWHRNVIGKTTRENTVEKGKNTVGKMLMHEKKEFINSNLETPPLSLSESTALSTNS